MGQYKSSASFPSDLRHTAIQAEGELRHSDFQYDHDKCISQELDTHSRRVCRAVI